MNRVSLVEFRKNAEGVIRRVQSGERIVLTRRGRPALSLEPLAGPAPDADDPAYHLSDLAVDEQTPLDDREIDRGVHGV